MNQYDFEGKRVLLAEDTRLNAEIARDLLRIANIETDHAWNGREAVRMLEKSSPGTYAAILMDVQMPEMDGYEAAKAIRALDHADADKIPIYALTASACTEEDNRILKAGMNGYIAKPIDTEVLYRTLYQAVTQ